ncbi:hypothetical protein CEUSTIGMA_g7957.t1 [Chlamydomonas eustigma]|uniref:EF-hand domain-containing protein n=1 Tax=Chlamydomonas eustigma TaxID=1157962 RepID=A0A250XCA8_9CHLO|nr:hypothetical protein CEUSTIGMA_g7957.t1 [Chlamydomonas eustigma]|eukprot:GAX80519.1 hypothetical protein CEUSTIGMA_g7957.t1 [Chlamydomonas eustigma]
MSVRQGNITQRASQYFASWILLSILSTQVLSHRNHVARLASQKSVGYAPLISDLMELCLSSQGHPSWIKSEDLGVGEKSDNASELNARDFSVISVQFQKMCHSLQALNLGFKIMENKEGRDSAGIIMPTGISPSPLLSTMEHLVTGQIRANPEPTALDTKPENEPLISHQRDRLMISTGSNSLYTISANGTTLTPSSLSGSNPVVQCSSSVRSALIISVGKVLISGITFTGCTNSAVTIRGNLSDFAAGPVVFQNCTFLGNTANTGAAVLIFVTVDKGIKASQGPFSLAEFKGCTFSNNSATVPTSASAVLPVYAGMGGSVFVQVNSSTPSNSIVTAAVQGYATVNFTSCTFSANHADVAGGGIAIFGDTNAFAWTTGATVISSTFTNNTADSGAAVYVGTSAVLDLLDSCEIHKNTCWRSPSVAPFPTCGAVCSNTALDVMRNAGQFGFVNFTTFTHNGGVNCSAGGSFRFDDSLNPIWFINVTFINNTAQQAAGILLYYGSSTGYFWNCTFLGNKVITDAPSAPTAWGPVGGAGLYLSNQGSTSYMTNCLFSWNTAPNGAGIMIFDNNELQLATTVFIENIASLAGGAVFNEGSSWLNVMSVLAVNNSAGTLGGAIFAGSGSTLSTYSFTLNSYGTQHPGWIPGFTYPESLVSNNQASFGGAYACVACTGFVDMGSTYQNNEALTGGALGLVTVSQLSLMGSSFLNNRAAVNQQAYSTFYHADPLTRGLGGAASISLLAPGIISNVTFDGNVATFGGGLYISAFTGQGMSSSPSATQQQDAVVLDPAVIFQNNRVKGGGGAAMFLVQAEAMSFTCANSNLSFNPSSASAADFGGSFMAPSNSSAFLTASAALPNDVFMTAAASWINMSTSHTSVVWHSQAPNPYTVSSNGCPSWVNNSGDMASVPGALASAAYFIQMESPATFNQLLSGSSISMSATLLDLWLQPVVTVIEADETRLLASTATPNASLSGTSYSQFSKGKVSLPQLQVRGTPGAVSVSANVTFLAGSSSIEKNELQISTAVVLRSCYVGEVTSEDKTACQQCPPSSYSLNPNNITCDACPSIGLNCSHVNGSIFTPLDNYWISHPFSTQSRLCPGMGSCLFDGRSDILAVAFAAFKTKVQGDFGNSTRILMVDASDYVNMQCAEGQTGVLCGACLPGFGHVDEGSCKICGSIGLSGLYYVFGFLILIIPIFLTVKSSLNDTTLENSGISFSAVANSRISMTVDKLGEKPSYTIVIKILVSYIQVVSVIRKVGLQFNLPSWNLTFFNVYNQASETTSVLASWDCLLANSNLALPPSLVGSLFTTLTPFLVILASVPVWMLLWLFKRRDVAAQRRLQELEEQELACKELEDKDNGGAVEHFRSSPCPGEDGQVQLLAEVIAKQQEPLDTKYEGDVCESGKDTLSESMDVMGVAKPTAGKLRGTDCCGEVAQVPEDTQVLEDSRGSSVAKFVGDVSPSPLSSIVEDVLMAAPEPLASSPFLQTSYNNSFSGSNALLSLNGVVGDEGSLTKSGFRVTSRALMVGGGGGSGSTYSIPSLSLRQGSSQGGRDAEGSLVESRKVGRENFEGAAQDLLLGFAVAEPDMHAGAGMGRRVTATGNTGDTDGEGVHTCRTPVSLGPHSTDYERSEIVDGVEQPLQSQGFVAGSQSMPQGYVQSPFSLGNTHTFSLQPSLEHGDSRLSPDFSDIIHDGTPAMSIVDVEATSYRTEEGEGSVDSRALSSVDSDEEGGEGEGLRARSRENQDMEGISVYVTPCVIVTAMVVLFFLYPGTTISLMGLYQCPCADNGGGLYSEFAIDKNCYYYLDYETVCYQGPHLYMALILGVPGVLFFSLGVPIVSAWFLRLNRYKHNRLDFASRYGFLYQDYTKTSYAWESAIMLRKLLVVVVSVFLTDIFQAQLMTLNVIIVAALALQIFFKPYKAARMNLLEANSLICAAITFYTSSVFMVPGLSPMTQNGLSIIILVVNLFFLVYALRAFVLEFYDHVVNLLDTDKDGNVSKEEIIGYLRSNMGFMGPPLAAVASAIVKSRFFEHTNAAVNKSKNLAHSLIAKVALNASNSAALSSLVRTFKVATGHTTPATRKSASRLSRRALSNKVQPAGSHAHNGPSVTPSIVSSEVLVPMSSTQHASTKPHGLRTATSSAFSKGNAGNKVFPVEDNLGSAAASNFQKSSEC